jgi:alkanesulfonate monooxygenase SsuD/methylene tetrahydromethanopterin reductase-like flavin-dependent oxidoreductase (luciferase family)
MRHHLCMDGRAIGGMRLGAIILQSRPWADLRRDFADVEEAGYDVAYVADHLTHPRMPGEWLGEAFSTLAAAAATTSLDLGTLVASAAFRSPVALARAAATVDDISRGRLVLGLGAGAPYCASADHGRVPSTAEMTRRFRDVVAGLDAVFAGETDWQGTELAFRGAGTNATATGRERPFLLLAAHGPVGFDLVGRYADGWSTYGGPAATSLAAPDFWRVVTEQSAAVTAACERHGKDPGLLRRSVLLGYGTVRPTSGLDAFLSAVDAARTAGMDEVVVYWPSESAGGAFDSDPEVHRAALARIRG